MIRKEKTVSLPEFLSKIFSNSMGEAVRPDPEDVKGFNSFFERYHRGLAVEKAAVEYIIL